MCQNQDCRAPVYQSRSSPTRLCKRHEMEERHKSATAQQQAAGIATPALSKPIHKKKLYPVKLDKDMRSLKRKRTSYGKSGDNDTEIAVASTSDIPKDRSSRPSAQGSSGNLSAQEGTSVRWPPSVSVEDVEDEEFLVETSISRLRGVDLT